MATVNEVYEYLDGLAPFSIQAEFDNAGFLVGRGERLVTRILVALDITQQVADEAAALGCELIVAHHPVIFHPLKQLTGQTQTGSIVLSLAERKIAAICAHTNLDAAQGGVNCCLAQALALQDVTLLCQEGIDAAGRPYGIGRIGRAGQPGVSAAEYAAFVKGALGAASVRFVDGGRLVGRVAVGGGSCASMLPDVAAAGCDTFITADVKHDQYLQAAALGITLMDAGHYPTENVVCMALADGLLGQFPQLQVSISKTHAEVYRGV